MKTEIQLKQEYKANDDQLYFAFENAIQSLQDKYGYDNVTETFLNAVENDVEYSDLVEASLEAIVSEGMWA